MAHRRMGHSVSCPAFDNFRQTTVKAFHDKITITLHNNPFHKRTPDIGREKGLFRSRSVGIMDDLPTTPHSILSWEMTGLPITEHGMNRMGNLSGVTLPLEFSKS